MNAGESSLGVPGIAAWLGIKYLLQSKPLPWRQLLSHNHRICGEKRSRVILGTWQAAGCKRWALFDQGMVLPRALLITSALCVWPRWAVPGCGIQCWALSQMEFQVPVSALTDKAGNECSSSYDRAWRQALNCKFLQVNDCWVSCKIIKS